LPLLLPSFFLGLGVFVAAFFVVRARPAKVRVNHIGFLI